MFNFYTTVYTILKDEIKCCATMAIQQVYQNWGKRLKAKVYDLFVVVVIVLRFASALGVSVYNL